MPAFHVPCLAILLLAAALPAEAVVFRAGEAKDAATEREAKAHQLGKAHPAVAALQIIPADFGQACAGTGTYLGTDEDGQRGYLLTAAHLFLDGPKPTPREQLLAVDITFDPAPAEAKEPLRIPATRVIVCDRYLPRTDLSQKDALGRGIPMRMKANDLALVEFSAKDHGAALAKLRVKPMALYQGTGYARPLLEAQLAGFGSFGTDRCAKLDRAKRIHGGFTRVTYGSRRGQADFHVWLPYSEEGLKRAGDPDQDANIYQTAPVPAQRTYLDLLAGTEVAVRSHPDQAVFAAGDSGGPLLFLNKGELKVAGVASQSLGEHLLDPRTEQWIPFLHQTYAPVMDHAGWVQAVMKGEPGKSQVLEVPGKAPKAGDGKTPKTETKS
jgi:hypothetical protein